MPAEAATKAENARLAVGDQLDRARGVRIDAVRHVGQDGLACRGHRRAARIAAQTGLTFEHRERRSHVGRDLGEQALLELGIAREAELCHKADDCRIAHSQIARKPHDGAKPCGGIIRQQPAHHFEL